MDYTIRNVKIEDLDQVTEVEALCFPAAVEASFRQRIETFPDSFFVAEDENGRIIGFINGCVTDERTIRDEMFEDSGLHRPEGLYQSVFGLDVIPEFRRQGVAADLMNRLMQEAKAQGKKGMILTCKDRLIHYYEKFGYRNLGLSASVHGGAVWYDMLLEF
ncbi:GNAT family N-acetyltransferase [Hungatella hathewayi]|uniref:GNAT family N-acetyltransferase n=1 Tax=Hungatella hathewayi TaxID=154046 RepID=A0AAW9WEB0_9FIRM|nr:GNAT family N-acetyltransferase [Hungatella hathewayi]MUB63084.1 GNAT family N-acetyltransferase [Hungatella hathewayi]CUP38155.1 Predicted acetyltransferase [Hungatella hathewayi]